MVLKLLTDLYIKILYTPPTLRCVRNLWITKKLTTPKDKGWLAATENSVADPARKETERKSIVKLSTPPERLVYHAYLISRSTFLLSKRNCLSTSFNLTCCENKYFAVFRKSFPRHSSVQSSPWLST